MVDVTTDSAIAAFSLVRVSTTTHSVNNDQRRIPIAFTATGANAYRLNVPSYAVTPDRGERGGADEHDDRLDRRHPRGRRQPLAQPHATGRSAVDRGAALVASDPDGDVLGYSAAGLPPGLAIGPSTGIINGTPTVAGLYAVTVQVSDGRGGVTTATLAWQVTSTGLVIDPVAAPAIAAGVFDGINGAKLAEVAVGAAPRSIARAPDGSAAYIALEGTGHLVKLNPSTGASLGTANVGANVRHLAHAADGTATVPAADATGSAAPPTSRRPSASR